VHFQESKLILLYLVVDCYGVKPVNDLAVSDSYFSVGF